MTKLLPYYRGHHFCDTPEKSLWWKVQVVTDFSVHFRNNTFIYREQNQACKFIKNITGIVTQLMSVTVS